MGSLLQSNNGYFADALADDPSALVRWAEAELRYVDFDTMVGTGLSGTLVVPLLARALGKHFAIIRKPDERSHSRGQIYHGTIGRRWIFVDDFISTGATRGRVILAVEQAYHHETVYSMNVDSPKPVRPVYVGDFTYQRNYDAQGFVPADPADRPETLLDCLMQQEWANAIEQVIYARQ